MYTSTESNDEFSEIPLYKRDAFCPRHQHNTSLADVTMRHRTSAVTSARNRGVWQVDATSRAWRIDVVTFDCLRSRGDVTRWLRHSIDAFFYVWVDCGVADWMQSMGRSPLRGVRWAIIRRLMKSHCCSEIDFNSSSCVFQLLFFSRTRFICLLCFPPWILTWHVPET